MQLDLPAAQPAAMQPLEDATMPLVKLHFELQTAVACGFSSRVRSGAAFAAQDGLESQ